MDQRFISRHCRTPARKYSITGASGSIAEFLSTFTGVNHYARHVLSTDRRRHHHHHLFAQINCTRRCTHDQHENKSRTRKAQKTGAYILPIKTEKKTNTVDVKTTMTTHTVKRREICTIKWPFKFRQRVLEIVHCARDGSTFVAAIQSRSFVAASQQWNCMESAREWIMIMNVNLYSA